MDIKLVVTSKDSLVDELLAIRVTGLNPGATIELQAQAHIPTLNMTSQAVFKADASGAIDLGKQAPLSGSYDWVDPMGLIWSMKPDIPVQNPWIYYLKTDPFDIEFTLLVNNEKIQTQTITRRWLPEGSSRQILHEGDLRGVCFFPPGKGPFPAVIFLGGSDGGICESRAALFAAHGYVALALGYFCYEDLSKDFVNFQLEYFEQAALWLQKQPVVNPERLIVSGFSRGAELALLLGVTFPFFKAVIAYAPSSQINSGGTADGLPAPAYYYKGKPIGHYNPPMPEVSSSAATEPVAESTPPAAVEPVAFTPYYIGLMQDENFIKASTIPVENTKGAILLISGDDDQIWPSTMFSRRIMDRLKKFNFSYPYEHFNYPDAGHAIVGGYMPLAPNHGIHPVMPMDFALGGIPRGQAFANSDSWQQVITFLGKYI